MKKNKMLAIILALVLAFSTLVACSSGSKYQDKDVPETEVVTDESGDAVTDKNGNAVTVVVDEKSTTKKGSSKTVVVEGGVNGKEQTTKSNGKKKETTTKQEEKPTHADVTTEAQKPIAPEDETTKKKDIKMYVGLPYFSSNDQNKYELIVTSGKKVFVYNIVGCRGQVVEIVVPKSYDGEKASFSINVSGKEYKADAKIKNDSKVSLQNIIIVDGDDD